MFLERFPEHEETNYLQLIRVKAGKSVCGVICGRPVRVFTHYQNGKTIPCAEREGEPCGLCLSGLKKRFYSYYPIIGREGSTAIVELTYSAEKDLLDLLRETGPSNSKTPLFLDEEHVVTIKISRKAGKRNNPLAIELGAIKATEEQRKKMTEKWVEADEIIRTLAKLWDLPEQEKAEDFRQYIDRLQDVVAAKCNAIGSEQKNTTSINLPGFSLN